MLATATKREYDCSGGEYSSGELLHFLEKSGIIDTEDLLNNIEKMNNLKIIQQHTYEISQGKDGRWRTYLPDETKPNNRRQIAKATEDAVHKAIVDDYKARMDAKDLKKHSLEKLFEKWLLWRRDTGTDPKTIKENKNDWNRFIVGKELAKKRVKDITIVMLEDFFLEMSKGREVTFKRSDVRENELMICHSIRRQQTMNDDLTFNPIQWVVEERIKGNEAAGFRTIPLTPKAAAVVAKALELNPDGEYLFMRDGRPLIANTFNKHLRRACTALDIPYRSSHQIRFTTATRLYEGGMQINQLSTLLGHSEVQTTFHYIRQRKADEHSTAIMANILDV